MSGIGFSELVVLFVIGLLILGPERLPRVAAQIGRWVGRARRTANQLRYQLEREIALADIEKKSKDRETKARDEGTQESRDQAQAPAASGPTAAAGSDPAAPDSEPTAAASVKTDSADERAATPGSDGAARKED